MPTSITTPGQKQTDQQPNVPLSHSRYEPNYQCYGTHRFGEYTPHFVAEGIPNDKRFQFRSVHQVRTFTLKSPLLSDLVSHKDYYMVPLQAILPNNWEKVYKNPKLGDDVPLKAGTYVPSILANIDNGFSVLITDLDAAVNDNPQDPAQIFLCWFRILAYAQWLSSNGSLLASLGCHLGNYFSWKCSTLASGDMSTDELIDAFFSKVISVVGSPNNNFIYTPSSTEQYFVYTGVEVPQSILGFMHQRRSKPISLREFWYMFLDQPTVTASQITNIPSALSTFLTSFTSATLPVLSVLYNSQQQYPLGIDFRRIWAYNLVVAHYYTNDNIDYIYSADLYRQLIGSYAYALNSSYDTFTYNGVVTQYDYMSAYYLEQFIYTADLPALSCIFNYHRSLKYIDYFTGCRARPLAVGNTDVTVNSNLVSVVDITRNIQKQRFLNAVNRAKSTIEGYIEDIMGTKPAYDFHNPAFLASTKDQVRGVENENTGAAQMSLVNSVTSVLRSNAERFMFETGFDRPCVVIGITYYDIPRIYMDSIDRQMMYKDRFDDFIPQMQFVGDQKLLQAELRPRFGLDPGEEFGYEGRYNEMKMRFNVGFGGFNSAGLRSWAFVNLLTSELDNTVTPNFIRSRQSDLDRYYLSLTGFSYNSYFHFIVVNTNYLSIDRPLVKKPQIL